MIIIHEKSMSKLAELLSFDLQINSLQLEISKFNNGEFKIEPTKINSDHVFVIFPKIDNINEDLSKFFLILGICQTCEIIDVLIPYIPYSRQDDSLLFKTVIDILKSLKVRKIMTIDIHKSSPGILNLLPHEFFGKNWIDQDFVVVAPDNGAIPRGIAFAEYLKTELISIDKQTGKTENLELAYGRKCLIVDDIIDSGKTIENAVKILKTAGAIEIKCAVSDFARNNICDFHDAISQKIFNEIA